MLEAGAALSYACACDAATPLQRMRAAGLAAPALVTAVAALARSSGGTAPGQHSTRLNPM